MLMQKLYPLLISFCLIVFAVGCGGSKEPDYVEPPESAGDPDAGVVIDEEVMGAPAEEN